MSNGQLDKTYRPYLVAYMSFLNNHRFEKHHVFTKQDLMAATAESVARWMRVKAFGYDVQVFDKNTPKAIIRSSTIEMCKKAVSWYMPYRNVDWNDTPTSNPTKSTVVNDLINYLKKMKFVKMVVQAVQNEH